MTPSERLVARVRARRMAARPKPSKGPDIRSKLNNARISLNNIVGKFGPDTNKPDLRAAKDMFEDVKDQVTSVMFSIGDETAKQHLVRTVLTEIDQGIDAASTMDLRGISVSAQRASTFLEGAIKHLDDNPDHSEKKERLARMMWSVFSDSDKRGDNNRSYEESIKLCKEIAEDETGKTKTWFSDVGDAIKKVYEAKQDLRSAFAFSEKMLPKIR